MKCNYCGAEISEDVRYCPNCGQEVQKQETIHTQQPSGFDYTQPEMSMTWHNILLILLIAGGILNLVTGFNYITGAQYYRQGLDPSAIYRTFPGLKICDIAYGIAIICVGLYQFYVRTRLKGFYADGPKKLTGVYCFAFAASLLYLISVSFAIGTSAFDASGFGSLLGSILMMTVNKVYYGKREYMFIN